MREERTMDLTPGFKTYLQETTDQAESARIRMLFRELTFMHADMDPERHEALKIVERSIARFVQAQDLLTKRLPATQLYIEEGYPDPSDPAAYEKQTKDAAIDAIAGAMQTLYPYISDSDQGVHIGNDKVPIRKLFGTLVTKMDEDRRSANWGHDILVSDIAKLGPRPMR